MGIKKKKSGPAPTYSERWQVLAQNINRLDEARAAYREANPQVSIVEAHRVVGAFHKKHRERYCS